MKIRGSLFFCCLKETMKRKQPQKKAPSLNPRRLIFCKEYVIDFNGTQAAIRAGFSEHTAQEQAAFLLSNIMVRREINRLRKLREKRLEASADFVVRELMRISKFDIRKAFDQNGDLKKITELSEDVAKCISGVEVDDIFEGRGQDKKHIGYTRKIKAWDKVRALEALGEHFGIFKRAADADPVQDGKQKKLDLLQVIKLISKDGQTTTIENRISGGSEESPSVAVSRPRGLVIV